MTDIKRSSFFDNALKSVIPIIVPAIAKRIIDLIPPDSTLEDVLRDYNNYWNKVAPVVSLMVLQLTNLPELAEDMVVQLNAEVAKEIKLKYVSNNFGFKNLLAEKKDFSIYLSMTALDKTDFVQFMKLLQSVSEHQRQAISSISFDSKDEAKNLLSNLIILEEEQFKAWAEIISPTEKPRVKTEFEKNAENGLKNFVTDMNTFFAKETWFERKARELKAAKENKSNS